MTSSTKGTDYESDSGSSSSAEYQDIVKVLSSSVSLPSISPTSSAMLNTSHTPHTPRRSRSLSLSVKLQTALASKLTTKRTIKMLVDENTGRILDNVYRLIKMHSKSKKVADRLINHLIKINLKLAVLYYNKVLTVEEMETCRELEDQLHDFCELLLKLPKPPPSIVSRTADFPPFLGSSIRKMHSPTAAYEPPSPNQLENLCNRISSMIQLLLRASQSHLSEKSKAQVNQIRDFFTNVAFYRDMFSGHDVKVSNTCVEILDDIQELMDRGII